MFDITNDINSLFSTFDFGIEAVLNNSNSDVVTVLYFNNYSSVDAFNSFQVGGNKPICYLKESDVNNLNIQVDDEIYINNVLYSINELKNNDFIFEAVLTLKD